MLGLMGCEPDTVCHLNLHANAGITAYRTDYDANDNSRLVNNWDSLQAQGIGSDSILYWHNQTEVVYLPMRADSSITAYALTWHEKTDTLVLFTTPKMQFISMACGCMVNHELDSVGFTGHFIDSVWIEETEISNFDATHVTLWVSEEEIEN